MTTLFPNGIDTFVNPVATDALNSGTVPHTSQHDNLNDAVLAIETLLGVNATKILPMVAGKNAIINGGMDIWQRGTSFAVPSSGTYTADRFMAIFDVNPTSNSISRQNFTPGAAPVVGYEAAYYYQSTLTTIGTCTIAEHQNRIEDVRTFAGQNVTLSFWAMADSPRSSGVYLAQVFGGGGSATVYTSVPTLNLTTSWVRYSYTFTLPSISGKTIGTNSYLVAAIRQAAATGSIISIWGIQLELGSTATTFSRAGGSIGGETVLCQRYLPVLSAGGSANADGVIGYAYGTNATIYTIQFPVQPRVVPTGITVSGTINAYALNVPTAGTPTFSAAGATFASLLMTPTITAGQGSRMSLGTGAYILFTGCEL